MIDFSSSGGGAAIGDTIGFLLLFSIPSLLLMVPLGFMQSAAARDGTDALRRVSRRIAAAALSLCLFGWLWTMPCWGKECDYMDSHSVFVPILVTIVVAWVLMLVWINYLRYSASR